MSARKQFQPKSRVQDEVLIARSQNDFSGGVYNDSIKTPLNGVLWLENAIATKDGIVSRTGTDYVADTTNFGIITFVSAYKVDGVIYSNYLPGSCPSGHTWSADDIGSYFLGTDGVWDLITGYALGGTSSAYPTFTTARNSSYATSDILKIRPELYCMKWCDHYKKWILQFGNKLWICDWDMTNYKRVYFCGKTVTDTGVTFPYWSAADEISRSITQVDFNNGYPILFNSSGIYKIKMDVYNPYYYKLNVNGPQYRSADVASTVTKIYGRRYLVTYSILNNTSSVDINRLSNNAKIEHESCPNITSQTTVGSVTNYIDYSEIYTENPISPSNPSQLALYAPQTPHWRYYSIWATLDIGTNGIANGNLETRYYFVQDVPMIKVFKLKAFGADTTVTIDLGPYSSGILTQDDVGCTVYLETAVDGLTSYTISAVLTNSSFTANERTISSSAISGIAGTIGADKVNMATSSNGIITLTGSGDTFETKDNGYILEWSDGTYDIIAEVTSSTSATLSLTNNIDKNTDCAVAWRPIGRSYFNDTFSDDILSNNRAGYLLPHRYFTPLPNCNLGVSVPGYIACAQTNGNTLYYCQKVYEHLIGSYNHALQYDSLDSNISALSQLPGYIIAYGSKNPGWMWPITLSENVSDQTENSVGESINILASRNQLNGNFGILCYGVVKDENGNDIVLTTGMELLIFNGTSFSKNMLSGRLMDRIRKLQNIIALHYDRFGGLLIAGTEDQSV